MKKLKYSWLLATALTACAIPTAGSVHDTYKPLFWPQEKRQIAFADAQNFVDVSTVEKGTFVKLLTVGPELKLTGDLDEYFETQNIAGLIVTHKGQIRLEKYAGGLTPEKDWSSFSVAKSITSTLVGAAIKDGHIDSLDSFVTDYIPELKDTAYEGVTIKHLLTMTSGVKWSENYSSPLSDVAKFIQHTPKNGLSITLDYMRQLKRSATPGEKFNYNTGETNLAGILVARATEQTLSDYLSEKIWKPYGMEADAVWALSPTGEEISGCCLSARLRDYARFAQFIQGGGKINGRSILPDGWLEEATRTQVKLGKHSGYGYFWWTFPNDIFFAQGIFGQIIGFDSKNDSQLVVLSNWPTASGNAEITQNRFKLQMDIRNALKDEQGGP